LLRCCRHRSLHTCRVCRSFWPKVDHRLCCLLPCACKHIPPSSVT
jgi:hypothetical protein